MSTRHRITDIATIESFVLGGNARFTLRSAVTDTRYTYRVVAPYKNGRFDHDATVRFVQVLTGPDNDNDYQFLGTVFTDGKRKAYRIGKKAKFTTEAGAHKAFDFFWQCVQQRGMPSVLEFYHAGACARCGRTLTTPESVTNGFGPECIRKATR